MDSLCARRLASPAIDGDSRLALLGEADEPDEWSDLLRKTAARLIEHKQRPAALALAAQCWQLGDGPAADRTLDTALNGVEDEKERITLQEAAVAFFESAGRLPEADDRLRALLTERGQAERAVLWREAAGLTDRRDMPARELECLERALDIENLFQKSGNLLVFAWFSAVKPRFWNRF